ncbi:MAG TPA: Gfo/Idh/MocA family oxidoreductase [Armatimonadota bacterium]
MKRIGIIGAGGIANKHAGAWAGVEGAQIVAVADPDAERVSALAERTGAKAYPSVEAMLADVTIDAADICVPTLQHIPVAMACLAARIPTIIEKPMARTVADARALVDAYNSAGVPLAPAHVVRFFQDFTAIRSQIESGAVGKPAVVRITRGGPFPRGKNGWYGDPAQSGGVLLDLSLHDFDWLRYTFGEVERVTANCLMAQGAVDRDYALAVLRFKSGVIAHVEGTWVHTDGFRVEVEISGDKGVLEHSSQFPYAVKVRKNAAEAGPAVAFPESPTFKDPYTAELEELLAAVTEGKPARVTAEDGVASLAIAEACWKSAKTGEPVTLHA